MMQLLTDDVLVRGDTQLLTTVAIGVIGMNLFSSAISLVQAHLIGHFGQRLQLGLILESGRKLLHLPLTYFEGRRSGEVVSRIADVSAVNALVSQIVLGLLSEFFIAIARAIITAAILILDESTGALDSVSEAEVLNRMLYY